MFSRRSQQVVDVSEKGKLIMKINVLIEYLNTKIKKKNFQDRNDIKYRIEKYISDINVFGLENMDMNTLKAKMNYLEGIKKELEPSRHNDDVVRPARRRVALIPTSFLSGTGRRRSQVVMPEPSRRQSQDNDVVVRPTRRRVALIPISFLSGTGRRRSQVVMPEPPIRRRSNSVNSIWDNIDDVRLPDTTENDDVVVRRRQVYNPFRSRRQQYIVPELSQQIPVMYRARQPVSERIGKYISARPRRAIRPLGF